MFMLGGASVAWNLRKEYVVALSSSEVEYIVFSLCACQAIWFMNFIDEIEDKVHGAMTMKIDNIFVINLAKNLVAYGKSEHIEMRRP